MLSFINFYVDFALDFCVILRFVTHINNTREIEGKIMGIIEGSEATRLLKHEINRELIKMPFNTSLIGYSMLVDAIIVSLNPAIKKLNLTRDVYSRLSSLYSVGTNTIEKDIKGAIESVFCSTTIKTDDITFPTETLKLALSEGRPKHVIVAMCQHMKLNGKYSVSIIN